MAWLDSSSGRITRRLPVAVEWPLFGLLTLAAACSPDSGPGEALDTAVPAQEFARLREPPPAQPTPGYGLTLGMTFTFIEPGTFQMGSADGQADERPPHRNAVPRVPAGHLRSDPGAMVRRDRDNGSRPAPDRAGRRGFTSRSNTACTLRRRAYPDRCAALTPALSRRVTQDSDADWP